MEHKKPKESQEYYFHDDQFKNDLNIIRVFTEKNYDKVMHKQEFYEINVITKGNGFHYIEDNEISVKTGDVFIIPPNISHGYVGGLGFDVFHILISNHFLHKFINDLQQIPYYFTIFAAEPIMRATTQQPLYLSPNEEQFNEISNVINELLKYEEKKDPISNISRTNLTMLFICTICKAYSENQESNENIEINNDTYFMKSISYIHENFNQKITIEDLCEISHLSRSTYIRKFKKICKMPPSQYIYKRKIDAAKNMLVNTQYSISEIAYKTGFCDASHLIKTFEDEFKTTPSHYRKENLI